MSFMGFVVVVVDVFLLSFSFSYLFLFLAMCICFIPHYFLFRKRSVSLDESIVCDISANRGLSLRGLLSLLYESTFPADVIIVVSFSAVFTVVFLFVVFDYDGRFVFLFVSALLRSLLSMPVCLFLPPNHFHN